MTSPRRRATCGGDDNVPVSHGAKGVVVVAGEHQRLTKDLGEALVRPEMPRARLATYPRRARRRAAADTTASAALGQRWGYDSGAHGEEGFEASLAVQPIWLEVVSWELPSVMGGLSLIGTVAGESQN